MNSEQSARVFVLKIRIMLACVIIAICLMLAVVMLCTGAVGSAVVCLVMGAVLGPLPIADTLHKIQKH